MEIVQVRNPNKSWHEVKRNLRQDHRWELASLLDTDEKEELFQQHVEQLVEKKRIHFRQLLTETSEVWCISTKLLCSCLCALLQISLKMPWKKARKLIKEDPRYKNFGDSDHVCECSATTVLYFPIWEVLHAIHYGI